MFAKINHVSIVNDNHAQLAKFRPSTPQPRP